MPRRQRSTAFHPFLGGGDLVSVYSLVSNVAPLGDRAAIEQAKRTATRRALEIRDGAKVAGSVAEMIEKFSDEIDPTHYADRTPHGKSSRRAAYENLIAFFGRMPPRMLRKQHGYQFLQARAKAGAPARANKEISQMAAIDAGRAIPAPVGDRLGRTR